MTPCNTIATRAGHVTSGTAHFQGINNSSPPNPIADDQQAFDAFQ
ncbi:MAG: hypothetical protein AAGF84_03530 [Planctomycetota bacterium]